MTPKDLAAYADGIYAASAGLIRLAPEDRWTWKPGNQNYMTIGQLCFHLSEATGKTLRGFITGDWGKLPEEGEMLPSAEKLPSCTKQEALARLEEDRKLMHQMLDSLPAEEFDRRIVSAPWGGQKPLWYYCMSMVEHLTAHKMQLFQYLKLLGQPVNTMHLYGM